ncbi:RDD family protein [Pseudonocardia sp.]|uniref:RDD family protein n=1 Tax=Pseudonocardia sp. TaxID=60912 RepID=UPI003D0ABF24
MTTPQQGNWDPNAYPPPPPQQPGHPGYAQPGYAQQGYPQPGGGYPLPGYGAPGYPPPGYPQQPGFGAPPYAPWGVRVGSYLIDALVPAAVAVVGSLLMIPAIARGDGSGLGPMMIIMVVVYLAVFGFVLWNSCYRQGTTGQSIGKKVVGTKLVRVRDGQSIGFGMAFVRQLAHVLDSIPFYLGYLWPLWDERRQTFADKVCDTVVVRVDT